MLLAGTGNLRKLGSQNLTLGNNFNQNLDLCIAFPCCEN